MGFNTTIVLMNDCLSDIKKDSELGSKIHRAVLDSYSEAKPVDVAAMGSVNAMTVIESHHSSGMIPILIGGNCGIPMNDIYIPCPFDDKSELFLLKQLADKLGYKITKRVH